MQYLKADTNTEVLIGPVVAVGDGFTPVTTLATSTADEAELIKYGGSTPLTVTSIAASAMTAITSADGYYTLDLSTSNTDTEGFLTVLFNDDSLCLPVRHDFQVVNANVYDSLFAAATTDYLDVNTIQVGATTQTAGDIPALVTTVDTVVDGIQTDLSNGTDGLGAIKADTAAILIDTDVIDDGTSGLVKIASDVASILVDTGTTLDTKLNDIQGGTFSSATDSLEAIRDRGDAAWTGSTVTSDSGTAQAGAAGTITLQAGASAVDDTYNGQLIYISSGTGAGQSRAISDYTGSTKVADVITNWGTTPDGTSVYSIYPNEITEITAAPTAAAVADAVWDENTTGHQTAGTFGQQVKDDIDAILVDTQTTLSDKIDVIDGIVDDILVDTAEIGAAGAGLTALATQASLDVVDGIVDNILVDTGTTLDDHLTDIKGTSFVKDTHSLIDIEGYVDILDDATSGNVKIAQDAAAVLVDTGTTLDTAIGTVDTVVDAIKVVTDKFAFTVANQVDANVESINATAVVGVGTSGNKWRA